MNSFKVRGAILIIGIIVSSSSQYLTGASIHINGNSEFTSANGVSSGSGTETDPYILQGLNASSSSFFTPALLIENTTAYFVLKNSVANGFYGFYLKNVVNGRVENCSSEGGHNPIDVEYSRNNYFIGNTFSGASGMFIYASSHNNTIVYNNLVGSTHSGIQIESSDNNSIHHNNFVDNYGGTNPQASDKRTSNQWDDGSEGNYWNDWISPDVNEDGIVDNPYMLGGGAGAKDNYPLVTFVSIEERNTETQYGSQAVKLFQNSPNPFSKITKINFQVPKGNQKSEAKLKAYDITGKLVRTFSINPSSTNSVTVTWDRKDNNGKELVPGIYFYRLSYDKFNITKKAILIK